jgi:hypothetical protein
MHMAEMGLFQQHHEDQLATLVQRMLRALKGSLAKSEVPHGEE